MLATLAALSIALPRIQQESLSLSWASIPTEARGVAFSHDAKKLAIFGVAGVQVFDVSQLDAPEEGYLAAHYPTTVAWNASAKMFVVNTFGRKGIAIPTELGGKEIEGSWHEHISGVMASRWALQTEDTGNRMHVYLMDTVEGEVRTHYYIDNPGRVTKLYLALGPKDYALVGHQDGDKPVEWGRVKLGSDDGTKGWKKLGKFKTEPPFSFDESGNLLASRYGVFDLRKSESASILSGRGFSFSADGKTLAYCPTDTELAFVNPKKIKEEKRVKLPFSGEPGILQTSPDGTYALVSDAAPKDANPIAEPKQRRVWIVKPDGQQIPLRSFNALAAYNQFVIRYLMNKTKVDEYLKEEAEREKNPPKPAPAKATPEPGNYPNSDISFWNRMEAQIKKAGYTKIDEVTGEAAGRNTMVVKTTPFYPAEGYEYYVGAMGDLAGSSERVRFFNLHMYVAGDNTWQLFETHRWDGVVHGSIAEIGGAFNTVPMASTATTRYWLEKKQMYFGISTDGYIPAKIAVYRRPAK